MPVPEGLSRARPRLGANATGIKAVWRNLNHRLAGLSGRLRFIDITLSNRPRLVDLVSCDVFVELAFTCTSITRSATNTESMYARCSKPPRGAAWLCQRGSLAVCRF